MGMKPTLLQINVTANSGSHGKIAEDIGCLALSKGWRSTVAYGRWANESLSNLIKVGSDFSIKEHGLESRLLDRHGLASRNATKRLVHSIKEIKPDIIHLHNIHGYYLNYKILFDYLSLAGIPVVWTLHDCWPFTGHCSHFDYDGCELWKSGCHAPCVCKGQYPKSIFFDRSEYNWLQKRMSFTSVKNMTLVPVSNWLGELVKSSFLGQYPVKTIHNGIDLNVFKPLLIGTDKLNQYSFGEKKIVLGVTNVWTKRKGLADFIQLRKVLSEEFTIVLVGVTEKQKKSLPQGVVGVCRTQNQQELAQLYSMADFFVNPTYEDNYPTTNLEAMACGTPVITYKTGGSPEAVTEATGWVVDQGDISAVANVINNERKGDKTIACRKRAEAFFDKNKCFDEYMDLYEGLLSEQSY